MPTPEAAAGRRSLAGPSVPGAPTGSEPSRWSGTPAAPDTAVFTEAELTALCHLAGETGQRTANILGLDRWHDPDEIRRIGQQSLIARGLADYGPDRVTFVAAAAWFIRVAQQARRWGVAAISSSDVGYGLLALSGREASALIELAPSGVHTAAPSVAGALPAHLFHEVCMALVAETECEFPVAVTLHLIDGDPKPRRTTFSYLDPRTVEPTGWARMASDEWWRSLESQGDTTTAWSGASLPADAPQSTDASSTGPVWPVPPDPSAP